MNKDDLIENVSNALFENRCIYFIGSGISKDSTKISWASMLEPFKNDIGIDISEKDNLPLIAQFVVNKFMKNRSPLIGEVARKLNRDFLLNNYHRAIAETKISCIYTTNYDTLLEKTFRDFCLDVKIEDSLMTRPVIDSTVEIIKLHGCIKSSSNFDLLKLPSFSIHL